MNTSSKENISEKAFQKNHPDNDTTINQGLLDSSVVKNGVIAGVLMSLFMTVVHLILPDGLSWMGFLQYTILAYFIYLSVVVSNPLSDGNFFQRGMARGATCSLIAGVAMAVINLVVSSFAPDFAIEKFNPEISDTTPLMLSNFGIILETFVLGMLLTFLFLQYEKRSSSSRPVKGNEEA